MYVQCVCYDSASTSLENGNACKMFAEILDRNLVLLCLAFLS